MLLKRLELPWRSNYPFYSFVARGDTGAFIFPITSSIVPHYNAGLLPDLFISWSGYNNQVIIPETNITTIPNTMYNILSSLFICLRWESNPHFQFHLPCTKLEVSWDYGGLSVHIVISILLYFVNNLGCSPGSISSILNFIHPLNLSIVVDDLLFLNINLFNNSKYFLVFIRTE